MNIVSGCFICKICRLIARRRILRSSFAENNCGLLAAILTQEVGWFDEESNNSNLVSARLSSDATLVKAAVGDRMSTIVQNFSLVVTAFCISFYLQWKVAGVVLLTFPLLVGAAVGEVCYAFIQMVNYLGDFGSANYETQ